MDALKIISLLSIVGMILSGYLTYVHYKPEKLDASFCNFNDYLSCSTVNKSSYAVFLGVPVAAIGILGFALLGILSLDKIKRSRPLLFYSSGLGLLFMLYLLFAELFIIKAICLYCIITLIVMTSIFGIAAVSFGRESLMLIKKIEFVD